jgi:phosphate uptake regulator
VFTNVFKLDHITNMIAQATVVLKEADPLVARYAKDLTDRIERRHRNLRRDPMLKPPTPATTNTVPAK